MEPCAAHRLYDLQYIDAGPAPDRPIDCLRKAPYSGPRWYPKVAAEHLLHHAVVEWQHFKWGLDATAHLEADVFQRPLEAMEEAWGDHADLAKRSINAALGILGCPRSSSFRLKSGVVPEAQLGGGGAPR